MGPLAHRLTALLDSRLAHRWMTFLTVYGLYEQLAHCWLTGKTPAQ
jgi:hypothetical protein